MTTEELNTFVRFYLGNLPLDTIDDATLNLIIGMVLGGTLATTDCLQKYYSVVETLKWLERRDLQEKGTDGIVGSVLSQREKEGNVEYESRYSSANTLDKTSWGVLLSNLLKDPTSLGCDPFPNNNKAIVIIGGADINGYDRTYETKKNRSESDYNARTTGGFPWRP